MSLTHKSINAFLWRMCEHGSAQAVQFVISIILARLLTPADFGLVGMLTVFTALAQTFTQVGFGSALIQRKNVTDTDYSTVFYFNIGIGGLVTTVFYFAAPLIADFYGQPQLTAITRVSTLSFVIGAVGAVSRIILRKELDFRRIMAGTLAGTVISGIVGISMAFTGFGVWALVMQGLVQTIVLSSVMIFTVKWRPSMVFCRHSLGRLFDFGSKVWGIDMLDTFFTQLHTLVIGKLYTAADLGQFTRAIRLQRLSLENLSGSFNAVLFPSFSKINDDQERFFRAVRKGFRTINFFSLPIICGMAVVAPSLILVVYGPQWFPAILFFQLLCITMLFLPSHHLFNNLILAKGDSGLLLKLSAFKKIIAAAALLLSCRYGIVVILIAVAVSNWLQVLIMALVVHRMKYLFSQQMKDVAPTALSLIVMVLSTYECSRFFEPGVVLLMLQTAVGAAVYVCMSWILNREMMQTGVQYLRGILHGRKRT